MQRVKIGLFKIYPGQFGRLERAYKIEEIYIPDEYEKAPSNKAVEYDYALVKLSQKVPSDEYLPLQPNFVDNGQ